MPVLKGYSSHLLRRVQTTDFDYVRLKAPILGHPNVEKVHPIAQRVE